MIKYLILLFPLVSFAEIYDYKIIRVIDGDTVIIEAPWQPKPLIPEMSLRIRNIDTPEKGFRAKCSGEIIQGANATAYTEHLLTKATSIKVEIDGIEKYGRLLGDVILDGIPLSQILIQHGYAMPYYGAKKPDWCHKH